MATPQTSNPTAVNNQDDTIIVNYSGTISQVVRFSIKDGILHYDKKAQDTNVSYFSISPSIMPEKVTLTTFAKDDIVAFIDKNIVLLASAYTDKPNANVKSNDEENVNEGIVDKIKDKANAAGEKLFGIDEPVKKQNPNDAPLEISDDSKKPVDTNKPQPQPNQQSQSQPQSQPQPEQKQEQNPEPKKEVQNAVQEDIYRGRDPQMFANISKMNDISFVLALNHLKINDTATIKKNYKGTVLDLSFDTEKVEKYINHYELKKLKLFINNEEIKEPKRELKFISAILTRLDIKIQL